MKPTPLIQLVVLICLSFILVLFLLYMGEKYLDINYAINFDPGLFFGVVTVIASFVISRIIILKLLKLKGINAQMLVGLVTVLLWFAVLIGYSIYNDAVGTRCPGFMGTASSCLSSGIFYLALFGIPAIIAGPLVGAFLYSVGFTKEPPTKQKKASPKKHK